MSGIDLSFGQLASSVNGILSPDFNNRRFQGVSIDSRSISPGELFIAISGDQFDGHDYIEAAKQKGAAGALVSKTDPLASSDDFPIVCVENTRIALGQLAKVWRKMISPRVIAITGSMGKTTTKELTRQILEKNGLTHYNRGNFNNDIGLPLTLLSMPEKTQYMVSEMGMSALSEIAYLAKIADPDIGTITNIAPVHVQGLGSLENIAAAKGELLQNLPKNSLAIVPYDELLLAPYLASMNPKQVITFGTHPKSTVTLVDTISKGIDGLQVTLKIGDETVQFHFPLVGKHNAFNAAAAAAIGFALNLPRDTILEGLSQKPALTHRSIIKPIGSRFLLDDCYNANPLAVKAALNTLVELAGDHPKVAVVGAMKELGEFSKEYHQFIGKHAASLNLDLLIVIGPEAEPITTVAHQCKMSSKKLIYLENTEGAASRAFEAAYPNGWILVKASRSAHLETVVEELLENT